MKDLLAWVDLRFGERDGARPNLDYAGFVEGLMFSLKVVSDELRDAGVKVDRKALRQLAADLRGREQRLGVEVAIEVLES